MFFVRPGRGGLGAPPPSPSLFFSLALATYVGRQAGVPRGCHAHGPRRLCCCRGGCCCRARNVGDDGKAWHAAAACHRHRHHRPVGRPCLSLARAQRRRCGCGGVGAFCGWWMGRGSRGREEEFEGEIEGAKKKEGAPDTVLLQTPRGRGQTHAAWSGGDTGTRGRQSPELRGQTCCCQGPPRGGQVGREMGGGGPGGGGGERQRFQSSLNARE